MNKRLLPILILLSILFCGCNLLNSPVTTELQTTSLSALSDEDLILRLVASGDLESWALQPNYHPESGAGILSLIKLSDEFTELVRRPMGIGQLNQLSPSIIEQTLQSENKRYALQGRYLAELVIYITPSMASAIDPILNTYN